MNYNVVRAGHKLQFNYQTILTSCLVILFLSFSTYPVLYPVCAAVENFVPPTIGRGALCNRSFSPTNYTILGIHAIG